MSPLAASDLLRATGLIVDGPVVLGNPVRGRGQGVFVIELATPLAEAPIDHDSLRRWLERVPELTLDGERPTPKELQARLASFWVPGEPVLFVSRALKAVGARLASMVATPLGDARPNPAGHWLKTLTRATQLRVWWANTEAAEEHEDELLAQFAERLGDPAALPFANLGRPTGAAKPHGLANSLRRPEEEKDARKARPVATARKPVAARKVAAARPARPTTGRATGPAAQAPTMLSAAGVADMTAELDHLRGNVRPGVIERVKSARELGDLRENADYEAARNEQSFVEGRIQALEALLRSAVVVEGGEAGVVRVGSAVVVEVDGEAQSWQIVGSGEADPGRGRISYASPVGQALVGRRAGDEVVAQLPRGEMRLRLVEVR